MDVGSRLRSAREAKGMSLEALSKATRVKASLLAAVENNDAAAIPPRPYGRGFVSAYASHVGLDPQQTVRDYFLQFATPAPAPPQPPPAARAAVLRGPSVRPAYMAAGVLLIAIVALAIPLLKRHPVSASPAASTSEPAREPAGSAPAAVGTGGETDAAAAAPPTTAPVTVEIEAVAPVWVTASADAQRTLYRTLQAGERETLRGDREVAIRVGNAGLVRWQVNGRPAAVMGARGAVQSVRVTAAGVEVQPSAPKPARSKAKRRR